MYICICQMQRSSLFITHSLDGDHLWARSYVEKVELAERNSCRLTVCCASCRADKLCYDSTLWLTPSTWTHDLIWALRHYCQWECFIWWFFLIVTKMRKISENRNCIGNGTDLLYVTQNYSKAHFLLSSHNTVPYCLVSPNKFIICHPTLSGFWFFSACVSFCSFFSDFY